MFRDLYVLHWGQVDRTLVVENVDPVSRAVPGVRGSSLDKTITTNSSAKRTSGMGSAKRLSGSGSAKRIKGSGRIC